jgi:hypothetical protein
MNPGRRGGKPATNFLHYYLSLNHPFHKFSGSQRGSRGPCGGQFSESESAPGDIALLALLHNYNIQR